MQAMQPKGGNAIIRCIAFKILADQKLAILFHQKFQGPVQLFLGAAQ